MAKTDYRNRLVPPIMVRDRHITQRELNFEIWKKDLEHRACEHVRRKLSEAPKNG